MTSLLEVEMMGICMFCRKNNHDFPNNETNWQLHDAGYHGCDVYGGFRFNKPLCRHFELDDLESVGKK